MHPDTYSIKKEFIFFAVVIAVLATGYGCSRPFIHKAPQPLHIEKDAGKAAEKWVRINVTPPFDYRFDIMKPGVLQHIDRQYTYDVVPEELMNGLLFQGVHRAPMGTAIELELLAPAAIYFFFHDREDGGYTAIFSNLRKWQHCDTFPQYDIHNGDHGMKMIMYRLEADQGTYVIPPTTKERGCFSIVFQPRAAP